MAEFGQLLGGLGLLLLALSMLTDGLRLAAGDRLTAILKKGTTPPWRGLASGVSMTVLVQSSSAVTVATIGFVNAGLMSLEQAITVIFGTNIGTTITGWIVAAVGFEFSLSALALVMVGAGMGIRLMLGDRAQGGFGTALAGFGLFFLGLDFLKAGFDSLGPSINLQVVSDYGALGILIGAVIGFVVTVLAQSSSAAVAFILTAAAGGAVMLPTAAAMVVGSNIGTTSTAVLTSIGATPNARRVSLAHIVFNLITGALALVLLVLALPFADTVAHMASLAVLLALFHTAFNVMGVLLIWPWRGRLARFLHTRFRTIEEDESRPRYLDTTLAATPDLAVQALLREIARIDAEVTLVAGLALAEKVPAHSQLRRKQDVVQALVAAVYDFVGHAQKGTVVHEVAGRLVQLMQASQYYLEAAALVVQASGVRAAILRLEDPQMRRQCSRHVNVLADAVQRAGAQPAPQVPPLAPDMVARLEESYHSLRAELLAAVMDHAVPADAVSELIETLSVLNRFVARLAKAGGMENDIARQLENGDAAPPAGDDDTVPPSQGLQAV